MKVPQMQPYIGLEEWEAIKESFEINWITEGPKAKEFSERLCERIGVKHAVFAPNGTLALYLGLRAIGIQPGDEVIVPDFTFIASANAIEMIGAHPIFVDVNEDLQINIDACESLITDKTKAIMPVHIFGMSAHMDKVLNFAQLHSIKVIEDSAQGLGVSWERKPCGSFGDVGCFSFFADKIITSGGEGGLVTTNDSEVYDNLRYLRNQGRLDRGSFVHPEIGYNFRMTDVQCAVGLKQLEKLDYIIEKKTNIFKEYSQRLSHIEEVEIITPSSKHSTFVPFRIPLMVKHSKEELEKYMNKNDIETRSFFYPLHLQPCYKDSIQHTNHFPNATHAYEHGLCLASFTELSIEQIGHTCSTINNFYNNV